MNRFVDDRIGLHDMQDCVKAFTEEETMTIRLQSVSAAQNIISDENSKKEHHAYVLYCSYNQASIESTGCSKHLQRRYVVYTVEMK